VRREIRASVLAGALIALWPTTGWAEWQIKPFVGLTFLEETTFIHEVTTGDDGLPKPAERSHRILGVSGSLLGEVFGVEGDLAYVPGALGTEGRVVLKSSVTTITANVIVGLPRKWTRYTLRPYVAAGGGAMRVFAEHSFTDVLAVERTLKVWDVGGGATGFLNDRIGMSWDLRYFRSLGGERRGASIGEEELSFYRATMALVIGFDRGLQ
jgi:hypothetical protein